jgi:rRNA-processing protein FCF1
MEKILADTSFIISCVRQGIDIFLEFDRLDIELVVPNLVIDEIEKLVLSGNSNERRIAGLALQLLKKYEAKIIKIKFDKNVDNSIAEFVLLNGFGAATLDNEIKHRLKGKVPLVYIRGEKNLEVG